MSVIIKSKNESEESSEELCFSLRKDLSINMQTSRIKPNSVRLMLWFNSLFLNEPTIEVQVRFIHWKNRTQTDSHKTELSTICEQLDTFAAIKVNLHLVCANLNPKQAITGKKILGGVSLTSN